MRFSFNDSLLRFSQTDVRKHARGWGAFALCLLLGGATPNFLITQTHYVRFRYTIKVPGYTQKLVHLKRMGLEKSVNAICDTSAGNIFPTLSKGIGRCGEWCWKLRRWLAEGYTMNEGAS